MLKIGIVGKKNGLLYIEALNNSIYSYIGIFDPSFQFEIPKNLQSKKPFLSFEDLLLNCDAIIFASAEKIYFPLIEMALKRSKSVFLHEALGFSKYELVALQKLIDEANVTIQVQHPYAFHEMFDLFAKKAKNPLLLNLSSSLSKEKNLLQHIRRNISAILCLTSSNVRKVTANTISSFSEVPDIIKVRIDFANSGIAEFTVNSIEDEFAFEIKSFNYNSYHHINFNTHSYLLKNNCGSKSYNYSDQKNTQLFMLEKQLMLFHNNVINQQSPQFNIENQLITLSIVAKIKEKLRLCINL